jgi:hypothetical protein
MCIDIFKRGYLEMENSSPEHIFCPDNPPTTEIVLEVWNG